MKARLTEQYDLTLGKREMDELVLALRCFVREFQASELAAQLLIEVEEVYQGGGAGLGVALRDDNDDEDGGAAVAAGKESE